MPTASAVTVLMDRFTAYAEADVINEHALEETDGLTAQLERDDRGETR